MSSIYFEKYKPSPMVLAVTQMAAANDPVVPVIPSNSFDLADIKARIEMLTAYAYQMIDLAEVDGLPTSKRSQCLIEIGETAIELNRLYIAEAKHGA